MAATLLPIELVIRLEVLAMEGPTEVVRLFAGVCAACASGCKKWADLLHVVEIEDASQCLILTSAKSKGKPGPYTWCLPKPG